MEPRTSLKLAFAVHEAVVLTGFSKYMLDYLARDDIYRPSGSKYGRSGKRRLYTYGDVVLLRALHKICSGKGEILHLGKSLNEYRTKFGPLTADSLRKKLLVAQGDKLCFCDTRGEAVELLSGQMTLSFVLDFSQVRREVASNVVVDRGNGVLRLTAEAARKAEAVRQQIWAPIKARREAA